MSKPHSASQVSFAFLVWMVVFAVLAASGGVTYSVLKNRQVAVRTETEKLRRDTALCKLNASQYHAKANALSNRWEIRDRLAQEHSQLRDIDRRQIEIARALHTGTERLTAAVFPFQH
ncbi:MAG: hypothetical protein MJ058_10065 [Akkermansia sp.]|nr:hypothetical protein [Akkermansia sp.]